MIFRRKKENLSFVQAAKKHNEKYEKEKILREKKEKRKKDIIYFLIKVKSYIIFITNKEEKSFAQVVEKQNERYEKEKIFREKKEKRKKNTIFLLKEDEKSFAQVVEEHNERYEKEKIFREKKEKRKKDIINFLLKAKNSTIFFLQEQCKKWMNFLAQQYKRWMNFLAQQDKKKWIIVLKVNLVYYACYIKEDLDLEMTRRYIAVLKPVTTKEECEREGTNQNARPKKKRDWLAIPPHEDAEEWLIKPLRTREMKEMVLFTKEFNEKRKKEMMNFLLKAKNFMILLPKLGARFIVIYLLATLLINGPIVYADAPSPWQAGFQDPATPIMEGIFFFNGLLMSFMLLIACLVGWLLFRCVILFNEFENSEPVSFNHSTVLEVVWTICPALVLMGISIPSYNLLYAMEEVIDPGLTIKVVGHQWYWSYEVSDFESPGSIFRLLEVDNRLFVPVGTHIRVLVTSADVLHSWAVPSLGVKIDACPGRLNQILIFIKRKGVFYGQCSEICGINHGFMPIVIESVSKEDYLTWVGTKLCS
uniref:Cytochrome c oxidase subunit 2 n=1 Tax=Phaeophyceae sp. TaxID=2249243 RepID=A0A8E8PEA4_9PHAE|nr:Cox2 [Phaeophyceae sp.]